MTTNVNRRSFLKLAGLSGSALVLGFRLPDESVMLAESSDMPVINMAQPAGDFVPNAFIGIDTDGTVTLIVHRSEMGQSVNTSVTMVLAEELEADWSKIRIQQAPPDRIYGDQVTGGSVSMSGSWGILLSSGATARTMLTTAAAQTWGVPVEECRAESGVIYHDASGQQAGYGELVEVAATLEVPRRADIQLKDPSEYRLIGQPMGNFDNADFVTGRAQFASDIQLPGMLVAVVARCPVPNGTVAEFDDSGARAVEGVQDVIEVYDRIAVLADSTWAAIKGRDALKIVWDEGSNTDLDSAAMRQELVDQFTAQVEGLDEGTLGAVYDNPYLAHATMEPMVCVADVRADSAEVWAPTQDRQQALSIASRYSGLPANAITLHVPLIGGGFGRRLAVDYVAEAVVVSQAAGAPVKLVWTREDDMRHDVYHPLTVQSLSATLDGPGRIRRNAREGRGVPTGAWRSVGEHITALGNECFVDELAAALERDPVELRRGMLSAAQMAVMELAAEKAGWGSPLPDGWGRGIAQHSTFGVTHVTHVAEVEVTGDTVRVHRVVCAVDCGQVVNPDGVIAQMEGGIIFGLTAALYGDITVENGRVLQSNFHDYPLLRFDEAPLIEVYIVPGDRRPSGVGEMGVPPIAPAVLNAICNATGRRMRHIPIRPDDLR
ncbi:MAG: xanthine dehydrogenase family protein molybdopterin-binding subunit [Anaerolineae bacterium]|nr:xanthine dehydrogenase family protein molybdopterin-binding subunit [Anaerolineae bacterium]